MTEYTFSLENQKIAGSVMYSQDVDGTLVGYIEYENYSISNIIDDVIWECGIVTDKSDYSLKLRNAIQNSVTSAIFENFGMPVRVELYGYAYERLISPMPIFNDTMLETVLQKTLNKLNACTSAVFAKLFEYLEDEPEIQQ